MVKKVKLLEIEIDYTVYTSFIEALAVQYKFDLAADTIDRMQSETGYMPT